MSFDDLGIKSHCCGLFVYGAFTGLLEKPCSWVEKLKRANLKPPVHLQNLERPFQVNKPGRVCLPYTKPRKASQGAHIVPAAATSRHIGNFLEGLRLYVCVKEPLIRMRPIIGFRPYVFAVWFLLASSEAAFSQTSTWRNITPSGGPQPEARRYGIPNNQSEHFG